MIRAKQAPRRPLRGVAATLADDASCAISHILLGRLGRGVAFSAISAGRTLTVVVERAIRFIFVAFLPSRALFALRVQLVMIPMRRAGLALIPVSCAG